ncbi:acetyltransferase [Alcanivorax sp.]|uniref:acetyltransferase n=1 Tax=Alcanivorax sp. TaxID=1872427 RepID=UPI000C53B286|nr:acetyltransferase [Alcanivorax sp.]MBU84078.1 acetyltransferase [Alcanivorax sp.]MCK5920469.1 acetyltransferase [Methylococcales bacterium]|tara:strand:- start:328 stop:960 length:633 start_codon:yes stop_codon:yes gene_type:complete
MKSIVIIGFGGFGREVDWLARECGRTVRGFLDDNATPGKKGNYTILGGLDTWSAYPDTELVVAIGNPRIRRKIVEKLVSQGVTDFATLIHPSVNMDETVDVGKGTMICAGSIATVDIAIGDHVILNLNVTVGHDDEIHDFVTVAPMVALSGNVTLEEGVEVGTGAAIRQGITMACGSMLGMGGILTKDSEANTIYVGSPAKPLKHLPEFI